VPGWLGRYRDSLRAVRSGDRIPAGARFFAPFQTGPGAHPASYAMSTRSFPGVRRPGRGVDHQPPSSAEVKERVELYFYPHPPWAFVACSMVNFTFTSTLKVPQHFQDETILLCLSAAYRPAPDFLRSAPATEIGTNTEIQLVC
jgi:hypothetical protein